MTLGRLQAIFARAGAKKLFAKPLAENDNSKNQVYFGPDFEALNLFPTEGVFPDGPKNSIFKAKLGFGWLAKDGSVAPAPGAQLILYPQYPEVRFSGFLRGCAAAPSSLLAGRMNGRILFLATTHDQRVLGYVAAGDDEIAKEFCSLNLRATSGVFVELDLASPFHEENARSQLLTELHRISQLGWIDSKQLDSNGRLKPCRAPQCGGFTLEAELGIAKNSNSEPDFLGWEVKQHSVSSFARPDSGTAITLMTPEPTDGYYKQHGAEAFVRKFGYPDKRNRPDRRNFGGIYRVGQRQPTTGLTMNIIGYDETTGRILDASGAVALFNDTGELAAAWTFSSLLEHWSRKHARAVYVPSMRRIEPSWQYSYSPRVRLAERTDGLRLLDALANGKVYYDPGIKLENESSSKPKSKKRSQFRVASKHLPILYETVETVEV